MRYFHDPYRDVLVRAYTKPVEDQFSQITWQEAMFLAKDREGWVVVPINELDRGFLAGDGWSHFTFQPTEAQRYRCVQNFGRPLEQITEGLQWSELWSILTDNMWRRIVPMRAFTTVIDWPKSAVL